MEYAINLFKIFTGQRRDDATDGAHEHIDGSTGAISIRAHRVVAFAAAIAGSLLLISFASDVAVTLSGSEDGIFNKLSKAFSVDRESNGSSFFSMLLLIAASALLFSISLVSRNQKRRDHLYWLALGAGFLFMAFDEIAEVHERLIEPIRLMLGGGDLGVLYYAWVIPGAAIVLLCVVVFFRFWWNLPSRVRFLVFMAAILYLGGAIGVESIGGSHAERYGRQNLSYVLFTWIEEALEISGSILFIKVLLDHLNEITNGTLTFRLTNRQQMATES